MSIIDAFGAIMDATHPTKVNPYYGAQQVTPEQYEASAPAGTTIPKTNLWLDAHGNDITSHMQGLSSDQINQMTSTPDQEPNFWARLGRNGREIANLNAQAQNLLGQQVQQRAIARNIGGMDYNTLSPKIHALLGNNPEQAKTLLGNNFSGQNVESVGQSLSDINSGLPGLRTASNVASANANIPLMGNVATLQNRLAANGQPTLEADNQSIGALNSLTQGIGENSLIPKRLSLQDQQLTGANAAQPNLNKELYNRSALGAATSAQDVTDLPSALDYLHNRSLIGASTSGQDVKNLDVNNLASGANAYSGAYEATHPNGLTYNPLAGSVDPNAGVVVPGRNINQIIAGQTVNQISGIGGQSPVSSGTIYAKPGASGQQGWRPLVGNTPTNTISFTGAGAGGSWAPDTIGQPAPLPQGQQQSKLPGEDNTITPDNAYDDVEPPASHATRKLTGLQSNPISVIQNGYQHIARQKLNDSIVGQKKLLKSIAKQYGTGSPHYQQAYFDYVSLVNSMPN